MISLLDHSENIIDLYVVHKEEMKIDDFPKVIINHKNLNKIKINTFNLKHKEFPNIENSHVSEATYYRIYLNEFLPSDISSILYVDADIIFLNDITSIYTELTNNLLDSKYIVAATTEYSRNDLNNERFNNLEMKSNKYLNAGVMFIDLAKWRNQKVFESLIETQNKMGSRLIYWDQDVFNSFLDGEYMEIPKKLNFNPSNVKYSIKNFNEIYENVICVHYNGKLKPWTVKGILEKDSIIFQNEYRKLGLNKFLITHIWRSNSLLYFLLSFINLKFFGVKKKISFTYEFFKSLFKKD
jgi:lipopolysaccharide biosynthesis glycosyltransferase